VGAPASSFENHSGLTELGPGADPLPDTTEERARSRALDLALALANRGRRTALSPARLVRDVARR